MPDAFVREIDLLIRARYPLLYMVTWEEDRARQLLINLANTKQKHIFEWSVTDGLRCVNDSQQTAARTSQKIHFMDPDLPNILHLHPKRRLQSARGRHGRAKPPAPAARNRTGPGATRRNTALGR